MTAKQSYRPKLMQGLLFDLTDCAMFVEADLAHLLRKPEAGIYLRTTGELLISSRKCGPHLSRSSYYYHDATNFEFVPVSHGIRYVEDIRGPIYNADLEPLVTQFMLCDDAAVLIDRPVQPIIGLQIVKIFIRNYFEQRMRWVKVAPDLWFDLAPFMHHVWRDPTRQVSDLENKERGDSAVGAYPVQEEVTRRLTSIMRPLLETIEKAVPPRAIEWAIIRVIDRMNMVRINVYEDYRICEWMNEHDQGRNLESLSQCDGDRDNEILSDFWGQDYE